MLRPIRIIHKGFRSFRLVVFIKLYENALFFKKYVDVKLHINMTYFGETVGTGQAEAVPKKVSQQF